MLKINSRQIYETNEYNPKEWILIIYSISANHHVGIPIYSKEADNTIYLKSINKYVNLNLIKDYKSSNITRCIYKKGIPIKVTSKEFDDLLKQCKKSLIEYININIPSDIEGIT